MDEQGVIVYSGGIPVSSAASITSQSLSSEGYDSMEVYSGGTATSISAANGGVMTIFDGGKADITTADFEGCVFVSSGGFADNTTIKAGGYLCVYTDGVADHTTVLQNGSLCIQGGTADNTVVRYKGSAVVKAGGVLEDATIYSRGSAVLSSGAILTGTTTLADGAIVRLYSGAIMDFNIANNTTKSAAVVDDLRKYTLDAGVNYTLTISSTQEKGTYQLAGYASSFNQSITVKTSENQIISALLPGQTQITKTANYSILKLNNLLDPENVGLFVSVSESTWTPEVRSNLKSNKCSQVVGWDAAQGKVGYMAINGSVGPGWAGVWEWAGEEASMWKVVGVGRFGGSEVKQDGILLYNGYGNTFAAWTNLNDPSYGYVSLCHVDGNFQTKCLADFSNNGFDDVIIYDENGSVGIVSGAAVYHDVWHVDDPSTNDWELVDAGRFNCVSDSILFRQKSTGAFFLWDNQDPTYATWNWKQTYIGTLDNTWECVAVGDFQGDGVDDIIMKDGSGNLFAWEDGSISNQRYVGTLSDGFKVESVGDYNGDGKEDLLLREYNSGWGGIGYWASADASQWTDLNARIETNMESQFSIVKG